MAKLTDKNRLSTIRPELCQEWDNEKNKSLVPHDISIGSGRKVWWICKTCSYEWNTDVYHRAKLNVGCPNCAGRIVTDSNRLSILYPNLSKEWDDDENFPLTPDQVHAGSHELVGWVCKHHHKWNSRIDSRSIGGNGCPYCTNQKTCKSNCLKEARPELAKEWHPTKNGQLTPENVRYGSTKKVWWICLNGHEWQSTICSRSRKRGNGCPHCYLKVRLRDGRGFPSYCEAFVYLKLKELDLDLVHNNRYNDGESTLGKSRYDFYLKDCNTYIEVTGYQHTWKHWNKYSSNIEKKKRYVESIGANFVFIEIELTDKEINFVKSKSIV